jgi:3-oxoacyl-[acyl-carrier-protein] synthase II
MRVYIKGMGNISPQQTWGDDALLARPLSYASGRLTCVEPDYNSFIDARQIRRMSRVIKMGVASSAMAMKQAGITMPDGIITATGYGCLEDTEVFLRKLIENKEYALNPTPFIQSTHNTIGSQIALLLQCQAYNQTYTQGGASFESALLDAMLQLAETPGRSLLVGGVDEIITASHQVQSRFGIFRGDDDSLQLFDGRGQGTLDGEGSAFFVVSSEKGNGAMAAIEAVTAFYKPSQADLAKGIGECLSSAGLRPADLGLLLLGKSGIAADDANLDRLVSAVLPASPQGVFKHLCGEYPVASAFACWLAANILKEGHIPATVLHAGKGGPVKNILILNQYFSSHYSLILLSAC